MPDIAEPSTGREPIPRSWLVAPLLLTAVLVLLEGTDTDIAISHWFFDDATQTFPLRQTFLLETVLHYWTKYVVILATCLLAAAYAYTYLVPALLRQRRQLLFLALAMTLAPLAVTALKEITDRPCPWDLAAFGGSTPYTNLFAARRQPHAPGLCFPAGHPATGFALVAFFFAAHRERRRGLARAALLAGIASGLVLGLGRIAQGAYFLSHVLWSGLVCWLVMVGLYVLLFTARGCPRSSRMEHI